MQLRWTEQAIADLTQIADYLFENTPERAPALVLSIYDAASKLPAFPRRGRPGRKAGTRELVVAPLPWLIIYRVTGEAIEILRVLPSARKWP
jgi:addiction module RelE/StbE family toxin